MAQGILEIGRERRWEDKDGGGQGRRDRERQGIGETQNEHRLYTWLHTEDKRQGVVAFSLTRIQNDHLLWVRTLPIFRDSAH